MPLQLSYADVICHVPSPTSFCKQESEELHDLPVFVRQTCGRARNISPAPGSASFLFRYSSQKLEGGGSLWVSTCHLSRKMQQQRVQYVFIAKLMRALNCSFTANVASFQLHKANVDGDNCDVIAAHPSVVQLYVWCTFKCGVSECCSIGKVGMGWAINSSKWEQEELR